ncbi:MAG: DUF4340 domain-containing protein [Bacteroidales bacterium]|nr:DUF4340 domain-containing protein [Bacteroidales bacterium]
MKKNNRITIIIAALLVVIAGVLIWNNRYLSTIQGESSDFQVWDTASVTKVYLADRRNQESLLERQENGWTLNGTYKAHSKQVSYLLTTLYKIRVKMPVSVASHDNIVKQLATQSTKVEVYQMVPRINLFDKIKLLYHEKRTKVFYVGDATMDSSGTFMLKEGADKAYIVYIPSFRGFITTRFTAIPDDWRDHTIFHETLADIQSVSVEFNEDPEGSFRIDNMGKHQYKLTRLSDNMELPYDTLKVINMLSSFSDLRFEALFNNTLPQERIDSITQSPYLHYVTLTTKEGNTLDMRTYKKLVLNGVTDIGGELGDVDRDRMYALINEGKDFVLIQNYVFDKVLHDVRYYEAGHPIQFEIGHVEVYE